MTRRREHTYEPPTDLVGQLQEMNFLIQDCAEWAAVLENEYVNEYRRSFKMKMAELESKAFALKRQLDKITPDEFKIRSNYDIKKSNQP